MGARDDLVLPSVSEKIDWEDELGVVIGRPIYRATPASEMNLGFHPALTRWNPGFTPRSTPL